MKGDMDPTDELGDLLKPGPERRHAVVRGLLLVLGVLLFALGFVGWLIPVVSGIPFYLAGIVVIAGASTRVRTWVNGAEGRLSAKNRRRLRAFLRKLPIRRLRERFDLGDEHPAARPEPPARA